MNNKEKLIELYKDNLKHIKIIGNGNVNARYLVVGLQKVDEESKPFSGFSGKLLDKILDYARIDKKDVFCTYLFKSDSDVSVYKNILKKEFDILEPKSTIVLGGKTCKHLHGKTVNLTNTVGKLISSTLFDFFPCYDIDYCSRNNKNFEKVVEVFKNAKKS